MAVFWSAIGVIVLAPLLLVVLLTTPEWWLNVGVWLVVLIPGLGGALLLGPAWYLRRRKLLRQEGVIKASGRASEPPSPSAR